MGERTGTVGRSGEDRSGVLTGADVEANTGWPSSHRTTEPGWRSWRGCTVPKSPPSGCAHVGCRGRPQLLAAHMPANVGPTPRLADFPVADRPTDPEARLAGEGQGKVSRDKYTRKRRGMSESGPAQVSGATRDAERQEAAVAASADRPPTAEEENAADSNQLDPEVSQEFADMADKGAHIPGEGQIG